jgi:hypothetical protein
MDLFSVSVTMLQLFQLEKLVRKEVRVFDRPCRGMCETDEEENADNNPTQIALRICLFYETAINLAQSIFDTNAKIAAELLHLTKGVKIEADSFSQQLESTLIPEMDPSMASFLATLGPHHDQLLEDSKNHTIDVAEVISSMEDCSTQDAKENSPLTVYSLESRVAELCTLVRKYANFMEERFTRFV